MLMVSDTETVAFHSARRAKSISGIEQIGTPWADGVPGLSQSAIQPGESYLYRWQANQYGSYFYHAHSHGQIDDGVYGTIIITPRSDLARPFDKIAPAEVGLLRRAEVDTTPLLVSDWRHYTSQQAWDMSVAAGFETSVCQDSLLVNGKGYVDCWPKEDIQKFTSPSFKPILDSLGLEVTAKG
jgi:FtsP/CotA-like multicopper oxidase with cupredoxin domain